MDKIADFEAFVAVIEKGSLTRAARHLSRSLQSVSRSLAALEREVGVQLIRRTTRRSNPTDAGLAFQRRLKAVLMEIDVAKAEASKQVDQASGILRLTASSAFAPAYVVPAIAAFLQHYPKIDAELDLSDRYVDLTENRYDLAVRIDGKIQAALNSQALANLRTVLFGAPQYFARHGRPTRPEHLSRHQCIVRTGSRDEDAWPFVVGAKLKRIKVRGRLRTTSVAAANEAAVLGLGIASAPFWQIRSLVDQNFVEIVLAPFAPPPVPVRAVWSGKTELSPQSRLFIAFLAKRLQAERL